MTVPRRERLHVSWLDAPLNRRRFALGAALLAALGSSLLALLVVRSCAPARPGSGPLRVVELADFEPDSSAWRLNYPEQFAGWQRTADTAAKEDDRTRGPWAGAATRPRLAEFPGLDRLYAGGPFVSSWNEEAGHALALRQLEDSRRFGADKPGACAGCKSSDVPRLLRRLGPEQFQAASLLALRTEHGLRNAVGCADCHDAATADLVLTRPWLVEALRSRGLDPAAATRQQLRSWICAQCHSEYRLLGSGKTVVLTWARGWRLEDLEATYDAESHAEWEQPETGVPLAKIDHPDFEAWSAGIHAAAGVACADCHLPRRRHGAARISEHWIRSPLADLERTCGPCHDQSPDLLRTAVRETQERTTRLLERAASALGAALDAAATARRDGLPDTALAEFRALFRRAFLRWDFAFSENSRGFHAPQESARLLAEAIDFARQAQLAALAARR
jgi:nitrite reductase (cytochrome c-552)